MKTKNTSPDVPGIDDCDHLYSLSSRSGDSSVYIRVQQADSGKWYAQLTVDCNAPEGDNFMEDLGPVMGPYDLPEFACRENLEDARQWFRDNGLAFVYCNNTRRIVRLNPRRTR